MPTKLELLAAKLELQYRLDQEQKKIRESVANDADLPEGAEIFDAASAKNVKELQAEAKAAGRAFLDAHPELSTDNFDTMIEWMYRRKLAPTVKNFEVTYDVLRNSGALAVPEITGESIAKMSADEFKQRLLTDSAFREVVERFH